MSKVGIPTSTTMSNKCIGCKYWKNQTNQEDFLVVRNMDIVKQVTVRKRRLDSEGGVNGKRRERSKIR